MSSSATFPKRYFQSVRHDTNSECFCIMSPNRTKEAGIKEDTTVSINGNGNSTIVHSFAQKILL